MHFATITVSLLSLAQYGACWGDVGHRTIGYVAEKCLSSNAHQYLTSILANDQGYDFSDAAIWADTIKRGAHPREYTKIWHYMGKSGGLAERSADLTISLKTRLTLHPTIVMWIMTEIASTLSIKVDVSSLLS
jgi:hypothetical protein